MGFIWVYILLLNEIILMYTVLTLSTCMTAGLPKACGAGTSVTLAVW